MVWVGSSPNPPPLPKERTAHDVLGPWSVENSGRRRVRELGSENVSENSGRRTCRQDLPSDRPLEIPE